jgi:putative chitinase
MPYDRKFFYDSVRPSLFKGHLSESQVAHINFLLSIWETHFEVANPRDGTNWLAYCLATVYHETAQTMKPIEEYGKGKGKKYGEPVGPYNLRYFGRGHVQLTWEENYIKGQRRLKDVYLIDAALHSKPHLMLEGEISALVLYDGAIHAWFTGVGLPKYFNGTTEDPINARRVINALDKAELIAGYYRKFKAALKKEPEGTAVADAA